jgi:hypothetical protein
MSLTSSLEATTQVRYSREHVHYTLLSLRWTLEKMQKVAKGRDAQKRAEYCDAIRYYVRDPSWLVFADRTAMDGRTLRRKLGWGARGQRVHVVEIMHRGKMVSVLTLFTTAGFVARRWVEGTYNSDLFIQHIKELIGQVLQSYPGPDSILVLDNCHIHHAREEELLEAVAHTGGLLFFLAPYSPCFIKEHGEWLKDETLDRALFWCFMNC